MSALSVLKAIFAPDGARRLVIYRLEDGLFSVKEGQPMAHDEPERAELLDERTKIWFPVSRGRTLCASANEADQQAGGSVSWLSE